MSRILFWAAFAIPVAMHGFFRDQYAPIKWILVYFFAAALALSAAFRSDSNLGLCWKALRQRASWTSLVSVLFVLYVTSIFTNLGSYWLSPVADLLAGLVIVFIIAATRDQEGLFDAFFKGTVISFCLVALYATFQNFGWEPLPVLFHNGFPASTFGFQNMTAEFLGMCFLLFLVLGIFEQNSRKFVGLTLLAALALLLIFSLKSRAAYLSMGLSILAISVFYPTKTLKIIFFATFAAIAFFVLAQGAAKILESSLRNLTDAGSIQTIDPLVAKSQSITSMSPVPNNFKLEDMDRVKETNTRIRITRWKNTLGMIQDHPFLGIGPTQFEYSYLNYRNYSGIDPEISERMLARSPHNGYLEAAADSGIPFFVLFVTILIIVFWTLFKKCFLLKSAQNPRRLKPLLVSLALLTYVAADAAVAFPMENAVPFFFVMVALGLILGDEVWLKNTIDESGSKPDTEGRYEKQNFNLSKLVLPLTFCTALILLGLNAVLGQLVFFPEKENPLGTNITQKLAIKSCQHVPFKEESCYFLATSTLQNGNITTATSLFQGILDAKPNHFPALEGMANAMMLSGNAKGACEFLTRYDDLFKGPSRVSENKNLVCTENQKTTD